MPAHIDIIIPVRNEEENIRPLIERIHKTFSKTQKTYALIVVDDHSTDATVPILEKLAKTYPVQIFTKRGHTGKAFSILEGVEHATAEFVAMIDADLQYPPEFIPEMLALAETSGIAVAKRVSAQDSKVRRLISRSFQLFFGKLLFGLDCDVQSGLKVFRTEILRHVDPQDVTPWTLDLPLLMTGLSLGYQIDEVTIDFAKRHAGESKIQLFQSIREIGGRAVSYKLRGVRPLHLPPSQKKNMIGAGIAHKGKRFVTHTTLDHYHSAIQTFTTTQKLFWWALVALIIWGVTQNYLLTLKLFVGILSFVYFIDVIFNLFLILKSLHSPPEISPSTRKINALKDSELPMYSILCPLYKEAHIIPSFLEAIAALDWPKEKLDVLLLLEEDDVESIASAKKMKLPPYVRVVVVPDSQPKTKPKACNYGLNLAKGEYLVIFDAEDIPDPLQLKKAYLGFQEVGSEVKCLQAKLNYHNPHQNLLTRFFTAEYSLWFDVILTGLQTISTTIPLGGTSNHFRTKDLITLKGWDPFNVTEDCDLGIRLFKSGWQTAIIDSVTLEEANSNWHNWLRQRSRWIKGYMQTYLIHMREPFAFAKEQGMHSLLFQLTVGGKLAFILINPFLWVMTIAYFALNSIFGPAIEALYPSVVFYMAVTSLIFGNFMFIYYFMIGCAKREHWSLMKWVYLVPLYWLMVSIAGFIALYQLIRKPHYWEKTIHGLHLKKEQLEEKAEEIAAAAITEILTESAGQQRPEWRQVFSVNAAKLRMFNTLASRIKPDKLTHTLRQFFNDAQFRSGFALVVASMTANVLNMASNFFLGSHLEFSSFAQMNTYISLLYLLNIPLDALGSTLNHHTALLLGKGMIEKLKAFWVFWVQKAFFFALMLTGFWLIASPHLVSFFQFNSLIPLAIFSPLIVITTLNAINGSYIRGRLFFGITAFVVFTEAFTRFLSSVLLATFFPHQFIYLTIPFSAVVTLLITTFYIIRKNESPSQAPREQEFALSHSFFALALTANLASIAFFSLDNVLVAHYLSAVETGMYGVLGLMGKMVFFTGSLTAGFILPIVSHKYGKGEDASSVFRKLFFVTTLLSVAAYIGIGIALPLSAPYFFGEKINAVRYLLPVYGFGVLLYTLSQAVVRYHLAKHQYAFAVSSFFMAILQIILIMLFHANLWQVVLVMSIMGVLNFVVLGGLHYYYKRVKEPLSNIQDFLDLFKNFPLRRKPEFAKTSYNILMFNWRDTRHVWAGGAEVYMHEVAKELVKKGHRVTLFCGNDGHAARNEKIDGVQMVRRGGFYTVYFWAFIYYIFRFRGLFDVVIDSENGIPFFTPLFVRKPKFLLIHHIHQEVFREHLRFPLSTIAMFIESTMMPLVYRNTQVITVSESSKKAIQKIGLSVSRDITVINPGIATNLFQKTKKTKHPTLTYVGRLKPYKNVEMALIAFARIAADHPTAVFRIAGEGESLQSIQDVVKKLRIHKQVQLLGRVSDEEKAKLFAESWMMIQPSMIEGWGITVIEANASGTPVIASNVAGLRDSIVNGHTGILVEPKNIRAFAQAMEELIVNTELRTKLSKNAIEWSKEFSWEKNAEKLNEIIVKSTTNITIPSMELSYVKNHN